MPCSRCDGLWLTLTSTVLVGATLIIMILMMAFTWHFEVKANLTLALALIFLLLLSVLAFLFAVYAAISWSRRSRWLFMVFHGLLIVGLFSFSACVIALRTKIIEMFSELWSASGRRESEMQRLETTMRCCGWFGNETRCEIARHSWKWPGCREEIDVFFEKYDLYIGGILLAMGALNLIPFFIALSMCKTREANLTD